MSESNINKKLNFKWSKEEDEIIINEYPKNGYEPVLSKLTNRSKTAIQQRAHKLGVSYLTYNENYFENINTSEKAYWIGFLCADGYVTTGNRWGIELQDCDKTHIEKLLKSIESNALPKERVRNNNDKTKTAISHSILFKNKKMYDDLVRNGVLPNKTNCLLFPDILSKKLYPDFIRGFIDGDGHYCLNYNTKPRVDRGNKIYTRVHKVVGITCKSEKFITQLQDVIEEECGALFNLNKDSRDIFTLRTSSSESIIKLINYIYYDDNIIKLDRKLEKVKELLEYCLTHQ